MVLIDSNLIAQYRDVLLLDDDGAHGAGWVDQAYTPENSSLISQQPDGPFIGGAYRWNGQSFDVVDQDAVTAAEVELLTAARAGMAISPRQCRLQLLSMSLLDDVESAMDGMGADAKIEWEYALEVKRTYSLVAAMQSLFHWTDAEMDTFFVEAAKL